jgi:hypothetical protein
MRRPFDVAVCWCSVKSSGVVGSEGSKRDQQKTTELTVPHFTSTQTLPVKRQARVDSATLYINTDVTCQKILSFSTLFESTASKKTCSWKTSCYYFFNLLPFPGTLSVTGVCLKYCMYYVSHSATCPAYFFFILSL